MKSRTAIVYKLLKVVLVVVLVLLGIIISTGFLLSRSAANAYQKAVSLGPYDAIVIPGLPYDSPEVNKLYKARMLWANNLYQKGIARHIILSGSAVHTPYVEALTMKTMCDSMGIPPQKTFIETQALHSTENIDYSLQLAQKYGFTKVAVATDPFQYFFLNRYVTAKNLNVQMLPFPIDSLRAYNNQSVPKINPKDAFVENFVPLKHRGNQ